MQRLTRNALVFSACRYLCRNLVIIATLYCTMSLGSYWLMAAKTLRNFGKEPYCCGQTGLNFRIILYQAYNAGTLFITNVLTHTKLCSWDWKYWIIFCFQIDLTVTFPLSCVDFLFTSLSLLIVYNPIWFPTFWDGNPQEFCYYRQYHLVEG